MKEPVKNQRKSSLNSRLRDARAESNWSQQQLADLVGTTPVNVSRWENGSTFPSPHFRQRLCEVFGKTPAELGLLSPSLHTSKIKNAPTARNPFFTGREQLLVSLHARLSSVKTAALIQSQALYGLGGIGKTQTAAEYAFRYGDEYSHVFWAWAANRETLTADFVALADLLGLPEKNEQDQQQTVVAVKRWLAANEGWLLILDNADNLPLVQEFLPISHKGYILLTTRSQVAGEIAAGVEVEKLSLHEGTLLLLRRAKILEADAFLNQVYTKDRADAERIVQRMDGLPLALVQAGAYIEETGCSLADYLRLYSTHSKDLLAWRSSFLLNYPETVATTWLLSFQQVEQANPVAADVLRFCAFLAPDAIPEELLIRGSAELGDALGAEALDPFKLNEALEVLRKYSLVRRDGHAHMLGIHRLVQTVLRDSLDLETHRAWVERTVRAVDAAFPEETDGYDAGTSLQYYLPHVQECATLIKRYHFYSPEAARLLFQAGTFLYFHGFYQQAQNFHQQAFAIREQILVSDHPTVAESLNALALLFRVQDDYQQAENFHRRALAIREKTLGAEHLTTSESLNNLGVLYRIQGKFEQAEALLQRALSIREQTLGSEHPRTLITVISLAKLYLEQRKYEQTERILEQARADFERALGQEHPLIAQTLTLLARLSHEQGNNGQAEILWKQALAIMERTLGMEHLALAELLNDLAELYTVEGRHTQAQLLCCRALSISERVLGPKHPDTISYRKHLSQILSKIEAEQNGNHHPASPDY